MLAQWFDKLKIGQNKAQACTPDAPRAPTDDVCAGEIATTLLLV
jgi:hypothetical protein